MKLNPENSAIILAIGTELTSGEVVNTNAAWLAEKLEDIGITVISHVVVPDDRNLILNALADTSKGEAQVLFVTGGLGPTSDDITREMIAKWAGVSLEFDEKVWRDTNEKYLSRGLQIRENHRHQCYFPKGSHRIANPVGTALGFSLKVAEQNVFVLPGPPNEIDGMWDQELQKALEPFRSQKKSKLLIWTLLGITESDAAERTEEVFKGHEIAIGYRASVPYVKVKIWLEPDDAKGLQLTGDLDVALSTWTVAKGREDLLDHWLERIQKYDSVSLFDPLTAGRFVQRISQKKWPNQLQIISGGPFNSPSTSSRSLMLWLSSLEGEQDFRVGFRSAESQAQHEFKLPYKITKANRRAAYFITEIALKWWLENLPRS